MSNRTDRAIDNIGQTNEKHEHIHGRGIIRDIALGLSDGVVTNVAFLAGFSGAIQNLEIIRLAGVAAMLAGAVSMFFGGLMAARSEHDLFKADSRREAGEIESEPEEERTELKNFYLKKGLTLEESEMVVNRVTSDKKKWLEDQLIHELHIHERELEKPLKIATVIGLSFLIGALVPLMPYLAFATSRFAMMISIVLSLAFLFCAGAIKGRLSGRKYWKSGLEMLAIGGVASALLFFIGSLLVFA